MYKVDGLWSDKQMLTHLGLTFEKVGKWMTQRPEERIGFHELWIRQWIATVDRYGKKGSNVSITVSWKAVDIKKINWKNLPTASLLDLGTLVQLKPVAREGAIEWCKEYQRDAPRFCSQVIGRD